MLSRRHNQIETERSSSFSCLPPCSGGSYRQKWTSARSVTYYCAFSILVYMVVDPCCLDATEGSGYPSCPAKFVHLCTLLRYVQPFYRARLNLRLPYHPQPSSDCIHCCCLHGLYHRFHIDFHSKSCTKVSCWPSSLYTLCMQSQVSDCRLLCTCSPSLNTYQHLMMFSVNLLQSRLYCLQVGWPAHKAGPLPQCFNALAVADRTQLSGTS